MASKVLPELSLIVIHYSRANELYVKTSTVSESCLECSISLEGKQDVSYRNAQIVHYLSVLEVPCTSAIKIDILDFG
jgi:hypothetical protein